MPFGKESKLCKRMVASEMTPYYYINQICVLKCVYSRAPSNTPQSEDKNISITCRK